jgi:phospholipid transport system substrate-binding protein
MRSNLALLRWALAVVLLTFVAGPARPAWASSPTDTLRAYTDQVLRVLEDSTLKPSERHGAVRKLALDAFDFAETAKRALARHWQGRTPAEREEFVRLFADLLERTYIARIDEYGGERVRYLGETVDGEFATVRARIVTRKGTEVAVESRMLRRGGQWLVYDVLIENVSLVANYRAQFDRIVRTTSFDELVRRLRHRSDDLLRDAAPGVRRTAG